MKDLILVKLGGSLITDKSKPYTLREGVLKRLAQEIHKAREMSGFDLIAGHGGGSFPHVSAKKYQTQKGIINDDSWEGFAKVASDAARLNRLVVSALIDAGEKAISIPPSSGVICRNSKIIEWDTKALEKYLEAGLLPVPYGDVGLDEEKGCCIIPTEEVLGYLAEKLGGKRIIMCGKTDGVFTADPSKNPDAKLIPEITRENFDEIKKYLADSDGIADVTGGMVIKVEKALEMSDKGIETWIVNGMEPDILKKAILGEKIRFTVIR
ncbi:MAG: isopentenyl phosphate kinase family protein [Candidatus Micrarchaeota archaeon]|nr:isopentenyl phosphate kinase family protein [Candidatus Micrarchaeota archaeon]